jgi:hypothetical protein
VKTLRPLVALSVLVLALLACAYSQDLSAPTALPSGTVPARPDSTATRQTATPPMTLQIVGTLNLRDRPDQAGPNDSQVLAVLPSGSMVTWLGQCQDGWARVSYGWIVGWSNNAFMSPKVCP